MTFKNKKEITMNFLLFSLKYTYLNSNDSFMLLTTAGTHLTYIILTLEFCSNSWAMCIWKCFYIQKYFSKLCR